MSDPSSQPQQRSFTDDPARRSTPSGRGIALLVAAAAIGGFALLVVFVLAMRR